MPRFRIHCLFVLLVTSTAMPVSSQERISEPTGFARLGLEYSPEYGTSALVGFEERNLFNRGILARTAISYGSEARAVRLGVSKNISQSSASDPMTLGLDYSFVNLTYNNSQYETLRHDISPYLDTQFSPYLNARVLAFYNWSEIYDFDNASPIITSGPHSREAMGIGVDFGYDSTDTNLLPSRGMKLILATRYSGFGGDVELLKWRGRAELYHSIQNQLFLSANAEFGQVKSLDDQPVSVHDRFFLGGASFLGFAGAGLGPMDDHTALGGNQYYKLRVAARAPLSDNQKIPFQFGVFYERGSLWNLDQVSASEVDFSRYDRQVWGVSLLAVTEAGVFELSYALPFDYQSSDELKNLSIQFRKSF